MQTAIKKENITAPHIEGPKIVGKIDLEALVPVKKYPHRLCNFPIKHYDAILKLAKKVCKELQDTDAVTVSKIAKIEGKEAPQFGTIWFSCERDVCKTKFEKPFNILLVELENNCRRISKKELMDMPYGQNFFMAYQFKNNNVNVSPCVKIYTTAKQSKEGICFTRKRDFNQNPNVLMFDYICDNGTFKAEKSEGYLFVSNETFKADL